MEKAFLWALIVLLAAAGAWALAFDFIKFEQIAYVGKMIAGWTAWTCFVALVYAGLEKLFPDILCPPFAGDC